MNAPDNRRRLAPQRKREPRRSPQFLAELRRQCRLANKADRRDSWLRFVYFPE